MALIISSLYNHISCELASTDQYTVMCRLHTPVHLFTSSRDEGFLKWHYGVIFFFPSWGLFKIKTPPKMRYELLQMMVCCLFHWLLCPPRGPTVRAEPHRGVESTQHQKIKKVHFGHNSDVSLATFTKVQVTFKPNPGVLTFTKNDNQKYIYFRQKTKPIHRSSSSFSVHDVNGNSTAQPLWRKYGYTKHSAQWRNRNSKQHADSAVL